MHEGHAVPVDYVGFDPADVEVVTPGYPYAEAVFLSGSLVAGFGHSKSDVDVFACFSDGALLARAAEERAAAVRDDDSPLEWRDGRRWDTELILVQSIDELVERVVDWSLGREIQLMSNHVERLYRVSVAIAFKGAHLVNAWKVALEEACIGRLFVDRHLQQSDGWLEDAIGFLDSDDVQTAAYCARNGFERVADALLSSTGRLCPSGKWRIAQLRKASAGPLGIEEYLRIIELREFDGAEWVERVIDRSRELMLEL